MDTPLSKNIPLFPFSTSRQAMTTKYRPVLARVAAQFSPRPEDAPVTTASFLSPILSPPEHLRDFLLLGQVQLLGEFRRRQSSGGEELRRRRKRREDRWISRRCRPGDERHGPVRRGQEGTGDCHSGNEEREQPQHGVCSLTRKGETRRSKPNEGTLHQSDGKDEGAKTNIA